MMGFFKIFVGFILLQQISCQCTFPTELIGSWVTSNDGTWIINTTSIQNYETKSSTTGNDIKVGISVLDFTCVENRGDTKYVIMSDTFELFNDAFVNMYTCIDIRLISSNKLIYYQATVMDPSGLQFTLQPAYEDVCNLASHDLPYLYHVGLKSGLETSALINCPSNIFGSYFYNDSCTDMASNETSMDVCDSRQQLIYNYTKCNTPQMFSQEGVLDCVYFVTSGTVTYLTVYNRDSVATDDTNNFRFTCLAIEGEADQVSLTAYPERCLDNQAATTIASPGLNYNLTSYNLCPIVVPTEEAFDWLPVIIAIVCVLLLLIIVAIIIICCCCCKRRKKEDDEEQAISEKSDSDDEDSTKNSLHEEDEQSLDSGISEPPPSTNRTDKDERILIGGGDGDDEDDKTSRPRSGENGLTERSRMSDLPPSTIPPEDEENIDEDDERKEDNVEPIPEQQDEDVEQKDDDDQQKDENDEQKDDDVEPNKEEELDGEEKETDGEKEEIDGEKDENDGQNDDDEGQKQDEQTDEEQEAENEADKADEEQSGKESEEASDNEEGGQQKVDGENPEEEEERRKCREDMDVSTDEEERRRIGMKKGKHYNPSGTLTSVLVSRDDEERKRQKQRGKTKKQKMNKLAKDKTDKDKTGGKGGRGRKGRKGRGKGGRGHGKDGEGTNDELGSSDEEARVNGGREAPFLKQYKHKKHIEHVLDDQHYWSDPEKDKEGFGIYDTISSKYDSDSSGSEEDIIGPNGEVIRVKKKKKRRHTESEDDDSGSEIEIIGPDGKPMRVKKKLKDERRRRRRKKSGDGDDVSNADSEYIRQKKLKRAGSLDSMMSVDDRKKLNEHKMKSEDDDNTINGGSDNENVRTGEDGDDGQVMRSGYENETKVDKDGNVIKGRGKTKTILVKEKTNEPGAEVEVRRIGKGERKRTNADGVEFTDGDADKMSDRDSGMDDEDDDVDVILTPEQQALIVGMLFDEEMNVRPQFYRDENGRIVRRLDNTIIYDPYTGRFTFRKRLGQIFKVPRLKRNDKGRPTGGYIEDEYGPKTDASKLSRKSSSARRNRSAKSGRSIRSTSADMTRTRTDPRTVGFDVNDDDVETMRADEAEFYKRGNRSHSAMQRLRRRLFGKGKNQRGGKGFGVLPDVRVKRAWSSDENWHGGHGTGYGTGGGLGPGNTRYGSKSPWTQRKGALISGDPNKMQMYREGLESDRKFLENLQGKLNSREQSNAGFGETDDGTNPDLANQDSHEHSHEHGHDHGHVHGPSYHGEYSFFDDDGKFVIRERGCPQLKNTKVPLFTIIRRPEDMESDEQLNGQTSQNRTIQSAPLAIQDYNPEHQHSDRSENGPKYESENSLARSDGRYSQYSYIDNNRLRRLLEELYKDKKYLDRYIETTEPKSEAVIHSKGLAEHGRGYLLERADYWERRGPLPPRPPMTDVGWKMQRQASIVASRQNSELGLSTNTTCTPDMSARHMPGVVESQNEENDELNYENKVQATSQKNESEA